MVTSALVRLQLSDRSNVYQNVRLEELIRVKHLGQCLAYIMHYINVCYNGKECVSFKIN